MIPTWMIEEIKRRRWQREQELERERPRIEIELPVRSGNERPPLPRPPSPVVIEFGGEPLDVESAITCRHPSP